MFNQLMHGGTNEVLEILDSNQLNESELRAALTNAFNRIAYLERRIERISIAMRITHQPKSAKGTGE